MSRPTPARGDLALVILLALAGGPACGDEGAVVLPTEWNTLKSRQILIDPYDELAPPLDTVAALAGVDGAPLPIHPALPDLSVPYRRKTGADDQPDGAHISLVRVGPSTLCALALDGIYPDPSADPAAPSSYDFTAIDAAMASVEPLGGATIAWRAAFAPSGRCGRDAAADAPPLQEPARWAAVVAHIALPLVGEANWDPQGERLPLSLIELFDAPETRSPASGDDDPLGALFIAWSAAAEATREALAELPGAPPSIASPTFALDDPAPLERDGEERPGAAPPAVTGRPAVLRLIDRCAESGTPLEVLSVRAHVSLPYDVRRIAAALRRYLDARALTDTELLIAELSPLDPAPLGDAALDSAYLGAFELAARIYLQDVPVSWALSGRGPFAFSDGGAHIGEPLATLDALLRPSAYFTLEGIARPAFMARLPLRQINGQRRVRVALGADHEGLAILASHPRTTTGVLSVLIAGADVSSGSASVTYDLRISHFVPPAVRRVDYRIATLDQRSSGLSSFFFSEVGTLEPSATAGDVLLSRRLPIPGVHFIVFEKPTPP